MWIEECLVIEVDFWYVEKWNCFYVFCIDFEFGGNGGFFFEFFGVGLVGVL